MSTVFVTREELFEMMRLGAIGEVTGWAYDAKGKLIKGGTNKRLTSIPPKCPRRPPRSARRSDRPRCRPSAPRCSAAWSTA